MRNILLTGARGQVGSALRHVDWPDGVTLSALDSSQLDITDRAEVLKACEGHQPSVVINAAAYTAVDQAETDEDRAKDVNATAVGFLTEGANQCGAMLIHISTDYVFDGEKSGWYQEDDATNPLSVYGRTKLAGEHAAAEAERSVVLRTSWVYSATGKNFVKTIRRIAMENPQLRIVADQHGCPTSATDIATTIASLVEMTNYGADPLPSTVYHAVARDAASWHQFAEAIIAHSPTVPDVPCEPVPTPAYPTAAHRPQNGKLDTSLLHQDTGLRLPDWEDSLQKVIKQLDAQ